MFIFRESGTAGSFVGGDGEREERELQAVFFFFGWWCTPYVAGVGPWVAIDDG